MNIQTVIGLLLVIVIFAAIVVSSVVGKKKGKSSCSCGGCSGCAMNGKCHSHSSKSAAVNTKAAD